MNLIVAPHPDDEIIGCYTILCRYQIDEVFYVADIPEIRHDEAMRCAQHFNFTPLFLRGDFQVLAKRLSQIPARSVVLVPAIYDTHPLHKKVAKFVELQKNTNWNIYYSTSMNVDWLVEIPNPEAKRKALNTLYPSQKMLWENDWRYILFEGYYTTDVEALFTA